ncbi:MAG: hypothetical protein ABL977_08460 [Candidatus Eisenbacteria bacterium]
MIRGPILRVLTACMAAVLVCTLTGCSKRHRISIQSNTCWIATIDKQSGAVTNDCGPQDFRVAGEIHCVAVTNLADTGFVRVRIDDGAWAESSAPRGTAETCR